MEKGQRGGAVQEGNLVMDNTRRCLWVVTAGLKGSGGRGLWVALWGHLLATDPPGAALSGVTMASNRTKIAGEAAHSSSHLQGKWELDASLAVTRTVQHCWRVWDQSLNDFSTVD